MMLLGGCGGCGAAGIFPGVRVVAGGIVASRGAEVEVVLNVEAPAELNTAELYIRLFEPLFIWVLCNF